MFKKIKKYINSDVGKNNQKNREIWLEKTLLDIPIGNSILDVGAGELQYKKFCQHLDYKSQDFGKYDGLGNQEGMQTKTFDNSKLDIISDIKDIPVEDNSFDTIMCIEVLEHFPEPVEAIKEFSRILKLNGKLIITAPFCSLTHFAPYYFANGYSKYWYEMMLKENSFKIDEIIFNGNFFEYLAQEVRRIKSVEKQYTDISLSTKIINKIGIKIVLSLLDKLSKRNKNSEELLCFGLQILATKK